MESMSKLKSTKKTYQVVEYHDLDNFIHAVTGLDYMCASEEQWSNDTYHLINVTGVIDDYDKKKFIGFKKGGSYSLRMILNNLCSEGHIKPGGYLIHVSW